MIIVKLVGGLGNQMFQYAFAKKLSLAHDVPVMLDNYWYTDVKFGKDAAREYALGKFKTSLPLASREDIARLTADRGFWFKAIRKVKRDIFRIDEFSFDPKQLDTKDGSYLEGYWQTESYFSDIRSTIIDEFSLGEGLSPTGQVIAQQEESCNSVSIHIRRGDYVSNKKVADVFGVLSLVYYHNAVRAIKDKVSDPVFFVFSDDIKWAEANLDLGAGTVYVSRPEIKDHEEIVLMSKCKHNIIANSSFSWWGAWLNQNPEKIVLAPSRWFKNSTMNTKDVVPSSWTKIESIYA